MGGRQKIGSVKIIIKDRQASTSLSYTDTTVSGMMSFLAHKMSPVVGFC